MLVVARISDKSSLEERDVKNGGIKVDKLEKEHFEGQIVIKFRLGSVHFWKKKQKLHFDHKITTDFWMDVKTETED